MSNAPLMPKATAVWLLDNTALTFDQVADFTKMHPLEIQAIADGEQQVPSERPAVAFTVPADVLLQAFGPGTYRMRIFADPEATPIAEGTFELHDPAASAAP